VYTRPGGDLYVTLRAIDGGAAVLTLDSSALMWMVWFGGMLVAAGGFVSVRGRRRSRSEVPVDA
jgi:LPXTG-motif cell wall-anchored protein